MIDFVKCRVYSFPAFALLIAAFASLLYYRGGFRYSIDFTGGTQLIVRFDKAPDLGHIRDVLKGGNWTGVDVSEFDRSNVRIRVQDVSIETAGKIIDTIQKDMPETKAELLQNDLVSSSTERTLIWSAIKAVLLALLAILCYIFIRFKISFALGAICALIHDTFVILSAFLLLNWEISIDAIAAILMILAYSNNDTIVIFSRIRERMKEYAGKLSMKDIVNEAIKSTLSRTLLTSFATALVVVSLLIFGGEVLRTLAFTLLVGIIFGTYSSIFIASPVMLLFQKNDGPEK